MMQTTKNTTATKAASTRSWLVFILTLGMIIFVFRYCIGIIIISGNSMAPTLKDGQILLANYIAFTLERGDIVIYEDHGMPIIKRVIGLPRETVGIKNGQVIINGIPLHEEYTNGLPRDLEPVTIPDDSYFLVGDNRTPGASRDSRDPSVGPIEAKRIKGEALFSIYPFKLIK